MRATHTVGARGSGHLSVHSGFSQRRQTGWRRRGPGRPELCLENRPFVSSAAGVSQLSTSVASPSVQQISNIPCPFSILSARTDDAHFRASRMFLLSDVMYSDIGPRPSRSHFRFQGFKLYLRRLSLSLPCDPSSGSSFGTPCCCTSCI